MNEPCHRCGGSGNDPEHGGPCGECWAINSTNREYDVVGDGLYAKLCQLFDDRAAKLHKMPGAFTHQLALAAADFTRRKIIVLESAIRKHRDQRGDDRCWMDDEELYAILPEGYTPPIRSSAVELKNCERFIASRQNPKTEYVSPEREIETLKTALAQAAIPLEVLYATECDDAAIALSAEIKSEIKAAVLAIRSALLNRKDSEL